MYIIGTGTTPVHSPLPKDDPLFLLRKQALFMQRSALKDLKEIGEGRYVLEATCVCPVADPEVYKWGEANQWISHVTTCI